MRHGIMAAAAIALALPQAAVAERHQTSAGEVEVTRKVDGLDTPWAVGFLPDGEILITERDGRLLLVRDGAKREVAGVPEVRARGQGGLLDVVPARDFAESGEIFLTYAEPREGGAATALALARPSGGPSSSSAAPGLRPWRRRVPSCPPRPPSPSDRRPLPGPVARSRPRCPTAHGGRV